MEIIKSPMWTTALSQLQGSMPSKSILWDGKLPCSFNDSPIDILFIFEIGIERAATFARGHCNIIHRGVFQPMLGEELSGHVHQFLSGLCCRHFLSVKKCFPVQPRLLPVLSYRGSGCLSWCKVSTNCPICAKMESKICTSICILCQNGGFLQSSE